MENHHGMVTTTSVVNNNHQAGCQAQPPGLLEYDHRWLLIDRCCFGSSYHHGNPTHQRHRAKRRPRLRSSQPGLGIGDFRCRGTTGGSNQWLKKIEKIRKDSNRTGEAHAICGEIQAGLPTNPSSIAPTHHHVTI